MNYIDTKLGQIENRIGTFTFNMAVGYILDKGTEFCCSITDEDIKAMPDTPFMAREFVTRMIMASREISTECCAINDLLPYIRKYMTINSSPSYDLCLDKEEISEYAWEWILSNLNIDDSKAKRLNLIVVDIQEEF